MIITYAIMAIMATILLIGYIMLVRQKEPWLLLLYICVTVVNVGYFLLSVSKTVEFALFANDLAYLGSVFLSMSMLLTIVKLCGFEVKRKLVIALTVAAALMFAIIATSGFLPIYYKEVTLVTVDGASKLKKVYGVLHPTYLVYLLAYFAAMVACIIQSIRKKVIASQRHASLLAAIVFGNIAVWLVEKFIPWNFEFLSVSYLFSELVLLGLYWMMQDYIQLKDVPPPVVVEEKAPVIVVDTMERAEKIQAILSHLPEGTTLSARQTEVLEGIIDGKSRKEIAADLHLSENTIKMHTSSLYRLLDVSSRDEIHALMKSR